MLMNDTLARRALVVTIVGALVVVACSKSSTTNDGGGGTGSGPITTSVNQSSNLGDLSAGDLTTYCHDVLAWESSNALTAAQSKAFGCVFAGAIAAAFETPDGGSMASTCKSAYESCASAPPSDAGSATDAGDPCAEIVAKAKGCHATVADVDRCFQDRLAQEKTLANAGESNCDTIGHDAGSSSDPSSCTSIATTCPSLFGSTTTGDAGP
jgi:hypothetical protein